MASCLAEECLSYHESSMQFFALYWGLATAYRAAVDHYRKPKAEAESQTMSPETNDAPTESTDIGIQTQPEASAVSIKSIECGTQTQLEVSTTSAKSIETGVQTVDLMDTGT
ncbi:hypothetical protein BTVI_42173 [Pitangus sulphuratus]|nr:hypothetical protein BTVI_42173 [Pitangus sulphuratus]